MKTIASLFNDFYSEFIYLVLDQKYISEMLIIKFEYKLILCLQNWLNTKIKLFTLISTLTKRYLFIYKEIQAMYRIINKCKLTQRILTPVSITIIAIFWKYPITNISLLYFLGYMVGIVMSMP